MRKLFGMFPLIMYNSLTLPDFLKEEVKRQLPLQVLKPF